MLRNDSLQARFDVITAQQNGGWPRALRQSLHWKWAIVERRVQLVVISRQQPTVKSEREPSQIMEIDAASSRWWEKVKLPPLPPLPRFSRALSGPLGNGMRETVHHSLGDVSQLKPNAASPDVSWEAYTLSVGTPGKPYVLEVEYPSDVPQTLGLSIVETNAAGTLVPIGLDSGINVSEEAAAAASAALGAASAGLLAANHVAAAIDHQSPRAVARRLWQDPRAGRLGTIAPQRCGPRAVARRG